MKVVRLSALRTGRLYPPGNIPGTHFCQRLSRPQGHGEAGRNMWMKNSNDIIGNRTRDLPTCRVVPQPTAPPCTPEIILYLWEITIIYTFNISICWITMECWLAGNVIQSLIFALIRDANVLLCTELNNNSEQYFSYVRGSFQLNHFGNCFEESIETIQNSFSGPWARHAIDTPAVISVSTATLGASVFLMSSWTRRERLAVRQ